MLADGTEIAGRSIASNVEPSLLYLSLVEQQHLEADFRERIVHLSGVDRADARGKVEVCRDEF